MEKKEMKNEEQKCASTSIITDSEENQDVQITMDEISAEKKEKETSELSEEGLRASVDLINPDMGSMDSRG